MSQQRVDLTCPVGASTAIQGILRLVNILNMPPKALPMVEPQGALLATESPWPSTTFVLRHLSSDSARENTHTQKKHLY